jgi:hypothetical protein
MDILTYRIAKYKRLPSFTSSMGSVSGFAGGLAEVMRPPASRRMQIPAATSLFYAVRVVEIQERRSREE